MQIFHALGPIKRSLRSGVANAIEAVAPARRRRIAFRGAVHHPARHGASAPQGDASEFAVRI